MITNETVAHLAHLARITISEKEIGGIKEDLEKILAYVDEVNKIDTDCERSGASQAFQENVVREDVVTNESGRFTESLTKLAPHSENDYITVKKILSHND